MGVLPLDTLVSLTRLHVYEAMAVHGYDVVDAAYIAECIDEDVTASYVKMAVRQLISTKELESEVKNSPLGGDISTGKFAITAKGIRNVENELQDEESLTSRYQQGGLGGAALTFIPSGFAPGADRLVSFSDNEPPAQKARSAVGRLEKELAQVNDIPSALVEFKDVAVAEVGALRDLINKALVRASIVLVFARRLLPWLAEKAGSSAIGELAKRALAAIIDWLT